ncbi:tetratricopeptide repeat protein [Sorangium sp. So ce385]|uniref:tetratricopeptide repeat protein n=1 Tax=Sorangium sp. So ce385 TaxID=3133308 RepID=UPI003F5BED27
MMKRWGVVCGFLLCGGLALAPARLALAQTADAAAKGTARMLAEEGLALYDGGDYRAALERFDRADALVRAPTMGRMAGLCLQKLGRLVEARERLLAVSRTELGPEASDAFRKAVTRAAAEAAALDSRIPKLSIRLSGAAPDEVQVTLDGKPIPAAMIGVSRLTDPGRRTLEGRRGSEVVREELDLKEGQSAEIALTFGSAVAPGLRPGDGGGGQEGGGRAPAQDGSTLRTLGWVGVGVGGAGLVLGGVTLGLALSARGDLESKGCAQGAGGGVWRCPPEAQGDVDRYNTLRPLPLVGFIAGGVVGAAGAVLLLTAPRDRASGAQAAVRPWVSPGGAGIMGVF